MAKTSILLLDCSEALQKKLAALGYDVCAGWSGYCSVMQEIPRPLYECNVVIYNPSAVDRSLSVGKDGPNTRTPMIDFSRDAIAKHLWNGGHWLVFLNSVDEAALFQRYAYLFVPGLPSWKATLDTKISMSPHLKDQRFMDAYVPLFRAPKTLKIKTPVEFKMAYDQENFTPLLMNAAGEALAGRTWSNEGDILFLPTFENNEDAILFYLIHVLPKLGGSGTTPARLEDEFTSPVEAELSAIEGKIITEYGNLEDQYNGNRKKLFEATQDKLKRIDADETAHWALECYREAQEDPGRAAGPLFKVLEAIGNRYGNDADAKMALLDCNEDWNRLKELTNRSDKNARHLPKPGQVENPLTPDEIQECFEAAKKMILAYLRALFAA